MQQICSEDFFQFYKLYISFSLYMKKMLSHAFSNPKINVKYFEMCLEINYVKEYRIIQLKNSLFINIYSYH